MSTQSQRMRKSSPCTAAKQGPMRATLPVSSLLRHQGNRQSHSLRKSNSSSPTSTSGSPSFCGQRSPGALSCKGCFASSNLKSKTLSGRCSEEITAQGQSIRRTASLDTIYLKGKWPRESYYAPVSLLVDKATQTEHNKHSEQQPISDEKLEKYFRHRLQRTSKEGSSSRERTAAFGLIMPIAGDHSVLQLPVYAPQINGWGLKASLVNSPLKPFRTIRSSIEGLNQEIEGLVLKAGNCSDQEKFLCQEDKCAKHQDQLTPEGHRAPIADLFRGNRNFNSVNTQTPIADIRSSSHSSGGSRSSSPEQDRDSRLGTSPHINNFLAREPPDGCEKINTKIMEDVRRTVADVNKLEFQSKPSVSFQLKPSLGSAFLPLHQTLSAKNTTMKNQSASNA